MQMSDLKRVFGENISAIGRAIKRPPSTVRDWNKGHIPLKAQRQIELLAKTLVEAVICEHCREKIDLLRGLKADVLSVPLRKNTSKAKRAKFVTYAALLRESRDKKTPPV